MKSLVFFSMVVVGLIIGGCAREALYVDKEHGLASGAAFDQQIVNKDYKYADRNVEGMDAIYAETIMGKYAASYNDSFNKLDVSIENFENKSR